MAKTSDSKIKEIQELYKKLGVYSQVAKELGVSPSTVSKYVKLGQEELIADVVKDAILFEGSVKKITDLAVPILEEWKTILEIQPDEREAYEELRKEVNL